jgi:hypothetical protein
MSYYEDLERETEENIRRSVDARENYIKKQADKYRKYCEEIEEQIALYINDYVKSLAKAAAGPACAVLLIYEHVNEVTAFIVLATFAAAMIAFNWYEKRRWRVKIIKAREYWREPTFEEEMRELRFSHIQVRNARRNAPLDYPGGSALPQSLPAGASIMFWLIAFLIAFAPAMLAQLRGHQSAGLIILLDLGGLTGLFLGLMLADTPKRSPVYALAGAAAWLGAFLWSLGR